MFADDPGRTKHSYSPPSELDYFDSEGSVGLIKCSSGPGNRRFGGGAPAAGIGEINARYAVEGAIAASNYVKPSGLRSEIYGLGHWLGFSALRTVLTFTKDETSGTTTDFGKSTTSTERVEDVMLARAMNLKATGYATGSGLDTPEVTYRSKVFLEAFVRAGREWDDHLALHLGVRNLLRISAWQPVRFQAHQAMSARESRYDGDEKNRWLEARTAATGLGESTWKSRDRHLFT